MEEQMERETNYGFYFVKFRPSPEEHEKEEAEKQYQLMNLSRLRINEEINQQRANAYEIYKKIMWFSDLDKQIEWKMWDIKNVERCDLGIVKPSLQIKSVPGTRKDSDRKHCYKRLIKKGQINMDYLQKIQEELLFSKKFFGMTSCGTQELNNLIESMAQRIKHGNKKRGDEAKIYHEIIKIVETREVYTEPEPEPEPEPDMIWYPTLGNTKWHTDRKRSAQHRINIRLDEIEKIKRDQMGRKVRIKRLKADLELVRKKLSWLTKELDNVNSKRIEAYKRACELGDQMKMKSCYDEYRSLMAYAKELARKGDIIELRQLCETQVEGFMKMWNDSKAFKNDYEIRKLVQSCW